MILSPWSLDEFEEYLYSQFEFSEPLELPHVGKDNSKAAPEAAPTQQCGTNAQSETNNYLHLLGLRIPVLVNQRTKPPDSASTVDIIAFGYVENPCYETDGAIEVPLVRRGGGSEEITVQWKIENVNVMAASWKEQAGMVTFPPGIMHASIKVEIIENSHWNLEVSPLCCDAPPPVPA